MFRMRMQRLRRNLNRHEGMPTVAAEAQMYVDGIPEEERADSGVLFDRDT